MDQERNVAFYRFPQKVVYMLLTWLRPLFFA